MSTLAKDMEILAARENRFLLRLEERWKMLGDDGKAALVAAGQDMVGAMGSGGEG